MKDIKFSFQETSLVSLQNLQVLINQLITPINKIKDELSKGYDSEYAFAYVPLDLHSLSLMQDLIKKKQALNPSTLVVIGIGGSNLGSAAIHEALNGKFYNEKDPKIKVYFADSPDSAYIDDIYKIVENELVNDKNVIVNVITKSGTTIETIEIFKLFFDLLKKYKPNNYHEFIVATTQKDSPLWQIALENNFSVCQIPAKVGGRFSVFTPVGLFPLGLLGIDIGQLYSGAHFAIAKCLDESIHNHAAANAAIIYYLYNNGFNINDTFIFSNEHESLGKWYRQLLAESIGKQFDLNGKKVDISITPTISIGSSDLHSVAQLYLAAQKNSFTTFIEIEKNDFSNLNKVMKAILDGVKSAYLKKEKPFTHVTLINKEFYLGQFMQMKMFEIVYLAYLFNINPFDQPNVEDYKKEIKNILKD